MDMPYIISFISQKGGVGKSTLARATAVELVKNSYSVKVADLDTQQGTVLDWPRRRLDNNVEPSINSVECYKTLNQAVDNANHFDFLIIDAPARSSHGTYEISKISNLVIQPSGASVDDLKPAVLVFHELIKKGIRRENLFFALCRLSTETENEAAQEYIQTAGYKFLDGCTFEKAGYKQAQNEGKTILESRFNTLNQKADMLIQSILDNFINLTQN